MRDACSTSTAASRCPTAARAGSRCKGPTGCRYLDDPRQRDYVQGGWNITGDTFVRDEDGYFWYQARSDDMIVSSGYNIAAPEVEEALLSHPDVAECAVVGVPDEDRGPLVKAYVVLRAGVDPGPARRHELQDFVKAEIAPYKYPRAVEFVDALPRTATGKLQRFRLRDDLSDDRVVGRRARCTRPRQLILSLYGLYAREEGDWLSVASLIALMADLGVDSAAVRSSVSRLKRRERARGPVAATARRATRSRPPRSGGAARGRRAHLVAGRARRPPTAGWSLVVLGAGVGARPPPRPAVAADPASASARRARRLGRTRHAVRRDAARALEGRV